MLGISGFELLFLLVIALLVLGPDKLPKFAADAGRFVRTVRRMATDARAEVSDALGPELTDAYGELRGLNPRSAARKHLFDGDDDFGLADDEPPARRSPNGATAMGGPGSTLTSGGTGGASALPLAPPASPSGPDDAGQRPPYDPDAT